MRCKAWSDFQAGFPFHGVGWGQLAKMRSRGGLFSMGWSQRGGVFGQGRIAFLLFFTSSALVAAEPQGAGGLFIHMDLHFSYQLLHFSFVFPFLPFISKTWSYFLNKNGKKWTTVEGMMMFLASWQLRLIGQVCWFVTLVALTLNSHLVVTLALNFFIWN